MLKPAKFSEKLPNRREQAKLVENRQIFVRPAKTVESRQIFGDPAKFSGKLPLLLEEELVNCLKMERGGCLLKNQQVCNIEIWILIIWSKDPGLLRTEEDYGWESAENFGTSFSDIWSPNQVALICICCCVSISHGILSLKFKNLFWRPKNGSLL